MADAEHLCRYLGGAEVALPNGSEVHRKEPLTIVTHMTEDGASVSEIQAAHKPTYLVVPDWIFR
ncbi:MAG: hypothetical protein AAGL89_07105 [Pseudomonadota bacterium]